VYVFDCSAAGLIVEWFNKFAEQRAKEQEVLSLFSFIVSYLPYSLFVL